MLSLLCVAHQAELTALPAYAQNPNYDVGPVWIVSYYHIKPGQGDAFWKDFRENSKPVYESLTPAARPEYGPFAR